MLGPHTVDVINPGEKPSGYGNATTDDWATATTDTITGCSVQPVVAPEYAVDRDNITSRWVAWLPPDTSISGRSRVRWRGDVYDVDGEPQRWDFGALAHIVVNLRRSQG